MQRYFRNRSSAIYGTAVGSQPSIRTEPLALRSQYPTHQPSLPLKHRQRNISNSRYIPGLVSSAKDRAHNRHSQHQSSHHRQPASFTAHGHSPRHTQRASRTILRSEMELEIRKWKVIQLQHFLKEHGINFHRNDNKARLFHLDKAFSSTQATTTRPTALPASEPISQLVTSPAYPWSGRGGSSSSREPQTFLSLATSTSSDWGIPRCSKASKEI